MMTFDIKSAQVGLFPFKFGLPLHIAGPSEGRSNGAPRYWNSFACALLWLANYLLSTHPTLPALSYTRRLAGL